MRLPAGRPDQLPSFIPAASGFDAESAGQLRFNGGFGIDQLHCGSLQPLPQRGPQPRNRAFLSFPKRFKIPSKSFGINTELRRLKLERLEHPGGMQQQFDRNTTVIQANAAQFLPLEQNRFQSPARRR